MKTTGPVLIAGGISFTNSWYNIKTPNWRIPVATFALALFVGGVEKVNEKAAIGLTTIMIITVLLTPVNGHSPLGTLASIGGANVNETAASAGSAIGKAMK